MFDLLSEAFAPLFGAGLRSITGINKSLIRYAIAPFIGAYTTCNNGLIEAPVCGAGYTTNNGLIEGLIAVKTAALLTICHGLVKGLFASVVELFGSTFAFIIGAHTDNCFERERKEKPMFDVSLFFCSSLHVVIVLFCFFHSMASAVNCLHTCTR